jgi:hypothetical protein
MGEAGVFDKLSSKDHGRDCVIIIGLITCEIQCPSRCDRNCIDLVSLLEAPRFLSRYTHHVFFASPVGLAAAILHS